MAFFALINKTLPDPFWVDLAVQNPLDAEVELSNLTLILESPVSAEETSIESLVEVEVVQEISLRAREKRTVRDHLHA